MTVLTVIQRYVIHTLMHNNKKWEYIQHRCHKSAESRKFEHDSDNKSITDLHKLVQSKSKKWKQEVEARESKENLEF